MNAALAAIDNQAVSSFILDWIGQAVVFGTVLAGLTWLLTRPLRRRSHPAFEAALWSIVLIKFLSPVGPQWSFSLASVGATLSQGTPVRLDAPHNPAAAGAERTISTSTVTVTPSGPQQAGTDAAPQPWPWTTAITALYLACVLSLLGVRAHSFRAFVARCRNLPAVDEVTRHLVADVCRRLGVRRVPQVRISDQAPAPFVTGLFRRLLVLSHRQLVRPDEFEAVIVHEIAHLRRGDVFVRYLQWFAAALLFFWPVVAWVNRRIDAARESACDQWALRHGRLEAGQYARCLLRAVQPTRTGRLAYHPAGMATNHTNIERRIDMILKSSAGPSRRREWGLLSWAFMLGWGGFALAGATGANRSASQQDWPATEEAVKQHAIELYDQVAEHPAADFNGDGLLTYVEKDTYLVALAMQASGAFMTEFPYADRNHSQELDILEAFGTIRGITLIAYADRRPSATPGARLDLEFYHQALDAQQWLLDNTTAEPATRDLDNIWSVIKRVKNQRNDHVRKLDHGCPPAPDGIKRMPAEMTRFGELENNIATIAAKMAGETNPREIARLQTMLTKLETLLAKLQEA